MVYKYKVTIGMPVYGVENYIHKCMLSVLNQTFSESYEILAVDDRGSDKSVEIIKELQSSHPRGNSIRIITQPQNMGCWAARNRILEESLGEYIFFLDSDDYISEDCIDKLYVEAKKNNADAVFGSAVSVDKEGNFKDLGREYLNQPYKVFHGTDELARYANQSIHPTLRDYVWNILIKHDFIKENHLCFKKAKFLEDLIFSADMIPLVKDAVLVPDHTYFYVIRENSLSSFQYRKTIDLSEIKEDLRVVNYIKNKCKELTKKDYFEILCTKGMILMFYNVCGAIKNKSKIKPKLSDIVIKDAMRHPLKICEIIKFKRYKLINILFYIIGILPSTLSILAIKLIAKIKKLI